MIDGHMKGTRLVCDYDGDEICSEEIGVLRIGCKKTPLKGSYFCIDHQDCHISEQVCFVLRCNRCNENAYYILIRTKKL